MSTPEEREEDLRRLVREPFLPQFDQGFYEDFGRYPRESPLYGTTPRNDSRRAAIQSLVERGATEGEREAARAALSRLDQAAQDEDDYLDALYHGAA